MMLDCCNTLLSMVRSDVPNHLHVDDRSTELRMHRFVAVAHLKGYAAYAAASAAASAADELPSRRCR